MEQILKVLDSALESKEFQIKYLNEELEKLRKERDELQGENEARAAIIKELESEFKALQTENKSLKDELNFYRPTDTEAEKEDF